jgi:LruC domain-containing protein
VTSSLFNSGDDQTIESQNVYYMGQNELPWALDFPEEWDYMIERNDISQGYHYFIPWLESSGKQHTDWFQSSNLENIDDQKVYLDHQNLRELESGWCAD